MFCIPISMYFWLKSICRHIPVTFLPIIVTHVMMRLYLLSTDAFLQYLYVIRKSKPPILKQVLVIRFSYFHLLKVELCCIDNVILLPFHVKSLWKKGWLVSHHQTQKEFIIWIGYLKPGFRVLEVPFKASWK